MKKLKDCFGYSVRVTDERLAHILDHPEMKEMEVEIEKVVQQPQIVRRSRSDATVRLLYEFVRRRLCVANGSALWLST
jgi:hypothetical protein